MMDNDWRHPPPRTRYRMFWNGAWRPVVLMHDAHGAATTFAHQAVAAVLFVGPDQGVVMPVGGGAVLLENPDYRTSAWENPVNYSLR